VTGLGPRARQLRRLPAPRLPHHHHDLRRRTVREEGLVGGIKGGRGWVSIGCTPPVVFSQFKKKDDSMWGFACSFTWMELLGGLEWY